MAPSVLISCPDRQQANSRLVSAAGPPDIGLAPDKKTDCVFHVLANGRAPHTVAAHRPSRTAAAAAFTAAATS